MSRLPEVFGPGSRDYESTSDRLARRNVQLAEARERRRGRLWLGAATGALVMSVASFLVIGHGEIADVGPRLPVAGSEAARRGVKEGNYRIFRIGQEVDYFGKTERLTNLAEIARVATLSGAYANATDLQTRLLRELADLNERDGTDYTETTIPAKTAFVVPDYVYCGSDC